MKLRMKTEPDQQIPVDTNDKQRERSPLHRGFAGILSIARRLIDFVFGYDFFYILCMERRREICRNSSRSVARGRIPGFSGSHQLCLGRRLKKVSAWTLRRTGELIVDCSHLPPELLRLKEKAAALASGPSHDRLAVIGRSFNLVRQDKKRMRVVSLIAAALFGLGTALPMPQAVSK
jgi:hypothetical protein